MAKPSYLRVPGDGRPPTPPRAELSSTFLAAKRRALKMPRPPQTGQTTTTNPSTPTKG